MGIIKLNRENCFLSEEELIRISKVIGQSFIKDNKKWV
jgi:hypothetical protein